MRRVHDYVRALVQADRFGGRVVARDADTLLLYDVPVWGDAQADAVRRRFPACEVSCLACPTSLSGFAVVLRVRGGGASTLWATAFGLACLAVCALLRQLALRAAA